MIEIPVNCNGKSNVALSFNIGGVRVSALFQWNVRDSAWYVNLESVNGANYSVRLLPETRLLRNKNRVLDSGDFVVFNEKSSELSEIGFSSLGNGFSFNYMSEDEVKAFGGLLA